MQFIQTDETIKKTELTDKNSNDAGKLSPIKPENLKNLPVKQVTRDVIDSFEGILGYTELHPEVVDKIMETSERLEQF